MKTKWSLALLLGVLGVASFAGGGTARADSARVTQGDAQAVFEAFGDGGFAIIKHSPVLLQGAPADGLVNGLTVIRPFNVFNGKHYCALDWHVIVLAAPDGGDASYTRQDFEAFASQVSIAFSLDGAPLPTERTATKRYLRDLTAFGITTAFYFQQGRVLAPQELAVGTHTLGVVTTDPSGAFSNTISFVVDAPGTGTCV